MIPDASTRACRRRIELERRKRRIRNQDLYLGTLHLGTLSLISFFCLDASVPRPLNRGTSIPPFDTSAPVPPNWGRTFYSRVANEGLCKSDAQKSGRCRRYCAWTNPSVDLCQSCAKRASHSPTPGDFRGSLLSCFAIFSLLLQQSFCSPQA